CPTTQVTSSFLLATEGASRRLPRTERQSQEPDDQYRAVFVPLQDTPWRCGGGFCPRILARGGKGTGGSCPRCPYALVAADYPIAVAAARPAVRPENKHPPRKVPSKAR